MEVEVDIIHPYTYSSSIINSGTIEENSRLTCCQPSIGIDFQYISTNSDTCLVNSLLL